MGARCWFDDSPSNGLKRSLQGRTERKGAVMSNLKITRAEKSGTTITVEGNSDRNGTCVLKRDDTQIDDKDFTIGAGDPPPFTVPFTLTSDPPGATYSVEVTQDGRDGKFASGAVKPSPGSAAARREGNYGRP